RNGPIMINHELAAIPLHPFTIDEVYVFIATDATGEGVPAIRVGDLVLPLFGADVARVESLKQAASAGGRRERQRNQAGAIHGAARNYDDQTQNRNLAMKPEHSPEFERFA